MLAEPESATRTDSVLRIWGGATGRRVNAFEGDWRELPSEAVEGRDTLPLLTLAASASPAPLMLDLSTTSESGLPTVWIERAFVRATAGEGGVSMQEKILLRRWLGSSLDVELPRVESVEVLVDGKRVEVLPNNGGAEDAETYHLTIPLSESKPNRTALVELRSRYSAARSP